MMYKADYQLIAQTLKAQKASLDMVEAFCLALGSQENTAFDADKFIIAAYQAWEWEPDSIAQTDVLTRAKGKRAQRIERFAETMRADGMR